MLTRFDDYPIHQTPAPVTEPGTGDRNFYDRYFFNGFRATGDLFFAAAMGLYPNRRVQDAAFCVVHGGVQYNVRASRLAAAERDTLQVGPITIDVLEPLQTLRVRVAPNPHGLTCDLVFRHRTPAIEEPRTTRHAFQRVVMDSTRLTQFGTWDGWIDVDGTRIAVEPESTRGVRDRSWGIRPVGEPEGGAPAGMPQVFWLWAPLHFDDVCTHFGVFEDERGRPWHQGGCIVRVGQPQDEPIDPLKWGEHAITWASGTRRARTATVTLVPWDGEPARIALEPIVTFQMRGLGYLNPEHGHGVWQGAEALSGERWTLAECDPLDVRNIHVQALVRARWGERTGIGVLEQLVIGPHAPSGFTSILDPAP